MLDNHVVASIKACIEDRWKKDELSVCFPNRLLREDVLELLDRYCTIIYFPLEGESNNGFNTAIPALNQHIVNFVFINTAQTIEKQVFTAAHELGHLWKVDEYVCTNAVSSPSISLSEEIINRFAAELLMPEYEFLKAAWSEIKKNTENPNFISIENILKVTAVLMNMFCVPYRSVILRLGEVQLLSKDSCDELLGKNDITKEAIDTMMKGIFESCGYVRFLKPTYKRWIEGLPDLLSKAEKVDSISPQKIDKLRTEFGLTNEAIVTSIDGGVEIKKIPKEVEKSNDN